MTTPDLLPCPFCGEMPEVENISGVLISCSCKLEPGVYGDIDKATTLWNTRADRWIPVSERLPEKNTPVLVYIPHENPIPMELYDGGGDIVWSGIGDSLNFAELDEVTHWMPLPLPPKALKMIGELE